MEFWFKIGTARVLWNGHASDYVSPTAGVKQGGILSPLFFAAYIDVLLTTLNDSKIGCFINGQCCNSLLYADDLLLLSISVSDLSKLIKICKSIFDELDLQINFDKTFCLRVGPRAGVACAPITIEGHSIQWLSTAKYLGIYMLAKPKFSCDWHPTKKKFFIALNSVLHAVPIRPCRWSDPCFDLSVFPFYPLVSFLCLSPEPKLTVLLSLIITFLISFSKLHLSPISMSILFKCLAI